MKDLKQLKEMEANLTKDIKDKQDILAQNKIVLDKQQKLKELNAELHPSLIYKIKKLFKGNY